MSIKVKAYEYRNEKEHLEADNSAHRVDSYSYCNHSWRYELHGSQRLFLTECPREHVTTHRVARR